MKIKKLIAAMDAAQLAQEARKRASLKSRNKHERDEIPDLVKKAFEKQPTQAQVKQMLLKEKWRPPGYLSVWEVLDLAGAYKFKEWSGKELEIIADPPKCLQVSSDLDLKNTAELIAYAFSNDLIKEGVRQPPSISGDNLGIWQDAWLYLHRVGRFYGVKTKEEAIDGWLREAGFIIKENRRYNAVLESVDQVKIFLRDALYAGKIKAVRVVGETLEPVPRFYWLGDNSAQSLYVSPAAAEILFEDKSVQAVLKRINEQKGSEQKRLVTVHGGKDVMAAAMVVYTECRSRGDKLNNKELQKLINRILNNKGKTLPKSWYKTKADIPHDLKRQRGEHSKCSLICEDWPKLENK